jgi:hypothetical protein
MLAGICDILSIQPGQTAVHAFAQPVPLHASCTGGRLRLRKPKCAAVEPAFARTLLLLRLEPANRTLG